MPQRRNGFTFAAGNARKMLGLPLYALGWLATLAIPRDANRWAFGSGSGTGEGALPLSALARANGHHVTWNPSFWQTARAGVLVVTHGFGDVNRYATRGAVVVQLWHGIPLKHIQLDSAVTFPGRFGRVLKWAYRRSARNYDLLPAASELSARRLRTAFGVPAERVVVTGDPRDDVLFTVTQQQARAQLGLPAGEVILYAPTWRDGEPDPAIPTPDEWAAIDAWLAARDALLVVRPHPHGVGDYAAGVATTARVRMLLASTQPDITPVLPAFDSLITDYSSIAFDFALLDRPIAFLAPDVARYSVTRGLYQSFAKFSGGTGVATWAQLLERLENPEPLRAHARRLADTHHAYRDGRNTARVYDEVVALTRQPREGTRMTSVRLGSAVAVTVADGTLNVRGSGLAPTTVTLTGPRQQLVGAVTADGDSWTASIPLLVSRWGGPVLPAPSGRYEISLDDLPRTETLLPGLLRVATDGDTVVLSAPLTDDERGAANQARLETAYRTTEYEPLDAVFFESFYGQNASDNPRGIDAALALLKPATARYWSVVDASVAVPAGAIPIIEGSAEWWRIRGSARVLVVNDWLRKRFKKRPFQTVLQTWHGTMLKKIAIDRPKHGLRATLATVLESRRWDILLAQNAHSSSIFRSAYRFRGPIWEEGYPRDDALAGDDGAAIKMRLGIPLDKTVLLYAPTWRDNRLDHIDHLDVAAFTDSLGPDYVTLIRGHSRTLRPGRDVRADNVIDVTGYPDVVDLFQTADVLITDYSSVMFDYSVTGKPIFFFTPDIEHYREQLRGFYFDLIEVAPGPVVQTPAELSALIRDRDAVATRYAEKYAAWRERFNPRDDGHAAQRVVERLIDRGAL